MPQEPSTALACSVQHNKHKLLLHQALAGYVADSTENKFGPLTIKHLPKPMTRQNALVIKADVAYMY